MIRRPPRSPLFPYPPLSRSQQLRLLHEQHADLEPLLLSMRERARQHGALRREAGDVEDVVDVPALGARQPGDEILPERLVRSEEHTSELQSQSNLVCRLLLE